MFTCLLTLSHVIEMADNSFSSMVLPHMTYLYENLDLGWRLVNALCDVGLLTWDNREEVMNQKEPRTARINRLLSEILPYRGPDASERFVEALKVSNQKHVVERLKEARRFGETKFCSDTRMLSIVLSVCRIVLNLYL